jgi:hypothetical protein
MKSLLLVTLCLSFSASAQARCIVEIFSGSGDPLGFIFQEATCSVAMPKCKDKLATLSDRSARCEITLDIPGGRMPEDPQTP